MFRTNSPLTILNAQAEALAAHLPAVFAGEVEGVHDARIATRRLRETLPLTAACQRRHVVDDLQARLKRIGRTLGQVRDTDVRIELLGYLETIRSIGDLPPDVCEELERFFENAVAFERKDLRLLGWGEAADAEEAEIGRVSPLLAKGRPQNWQAAELKAPPRPSRTAIRVGDPVSMAAVRMALAQEGRDPSGAALAVSAPAAAPAMVVANCSDHRDRSQVWESASSAQIGGIAERRPSRGSERDFSCDPECEAQRVVRLPRRDSYRPP